MSVAPDTRRALVAAWIVLVVVGLPAGRARGQGQRPGTVTEPGSAPPTGIISGVVVDGRTSAPIPDAVVAIRAPGIAMPTDQPRQLTDARGRFVFPNLPASPAYTVTAARAGYLPAEAGPSGAAQQARTLALEDGQWLGNVRVTLWRPGVIAGTVRDEAGEPVVGVGVRLIARLQVAGHTRLAGGPVTKTDDLGAYRFADIVPGRYLVEVPSTQTAVPVSHEIRAPRPGDSPIPMLSIDAGIDLALSSEGPVPPPPDGRLLVYPTAFHGGQTPDAATVLSIGLGEARDGIDVRLAPVPTGTVVGRLVGPADATAGKLVRLVPAGLEDLTEVEAAVTISEGDGRFTFVGVPAGSYTVDTSPTSNEYAVGALPAGGMVSLRPPQPIFQMSGWSRGDVDVGPPGTSFVTRRYGANSEYVGRATVVVIDGAASEIAVPLVEMGSVTGHVAFWPVGPDPGVPQYAYVTAEAADGSPGLAVPNATTRPTAPDWAFEITGFDAGRYVLRVTASPPWMLRSITANGRDVTDVPLDMTGGGPRTLEVTLTESSSVITGTVRDAAGAVVGDTGVVVFPTDADRWRDVGLHPRRIRTATSASDGRYRIGNLPAGDYYVAAIDPADLRSWQDPAFLETMAGRAVRVTVDWDDTSPQDLRWTPR